MTDIATSEIAAPPAPGEVTQSVDIGPARWQYYRSYIAGKAAALMNLIQAISEEDESRFDDGTLDPDFEETTIEQLGQVEKEAMDLVRMTNRFRQNVHIRPKDPIPPE